jgi:hypothetical protein
MIGFVRRPAHSFRYSIAKLVLFVIEHDVIGMEAMANRTQPLQWRSRIALQSNQKPRKTVPQSPGFVDGGTVRRAQPCEVAGKLSLPPARLLALSAFAARRPRSPFAKEITMRSAASALLILGATACPASASATVIQAIASTWGCQFSATLSLFPEHFTDSQEDFDRVLDSGHCLVIDAHQRLTVLRNLPSTYVALRDMQQDDQWVVVFVRKSDFEQLPDGSYPRSGPNRRMTRAHFGSRGASAFSAPPHGPDSPSHPTTVEKVHHSRLAVQETVGPH